MACDRRKAHRLWPPLRMMSDLDALNVLLAEIATANDGANHGSDYVLDTLPTAGSLKLALDAYFAAMRTSLSPPQSAEQWNIRVTEWTDAQPRLRAAAQHWFYEQEFSPIVHENTTEQTLTAFMTRLESIVGESRVFEVNVDPPMWYECAWQDFAFDRGANRWLLHFGFSD